MDLDQLLLESSDPNYALFHSKLVPGKTILGVSTPKLEAIAQTLPVSFLDEELPNTYEYAILYGFVLGRAKLDFPTRLYYLEKWFKRNDNWAVNDLVCSRQKWVKKAKADLIPYLYSWIETNNAWIQRYVYTTLLSFYKEESDLDLIFSLVSQGYRQEYYTQMGVAWLLSALLIAFPNQTEAFMLSSSLDDFTFNKALQKARESRKIQPEKKEFYQRLKRK